MTASSTISKEDFEKLRGKLATQWRTDFPGKVQPFEVIFNETSKENSTFAQMPVVAPQARIRNSTDDLTKRLRPNHTEG